MAAGILCSSHYIHSGWCDKERNKFLPFYESKQWALYVAIKSSLFTTLFAALLSNLSNSHSHKLVAVWLSRNALVSINKVTLRRARLVLGWVTVCGVQLLVRENLSQYITSHPDQLSLTIPLWVGTMSISQRAVMLCGWAVKAGMVRVWVAGKTVWSPCYHGLYLTALAMGSSHNRVLNKCPIALTLLLTFVVWFCPSCLNSLNKKVYDIISIFRMAATAFHIYFGLRVGWRHSFKVEMHMQIKLQSDIKIHI